MTSAAAGNAVLRHLELCAQSGNAGQAEDLAYAVYLIQSGADISVTCSRGNALSCAAFHGQAEAVGAVIGRLQSSDAVVQLNAHNANGCSALMFAANNGHKDVVALLLASGAHNHLTDKLGFTAAIRAKKKGHHDIAAMIENPGTSEECSRAAVQVSVYRLFVMCRVTDHSDFLWQFNDYWLSNLDAAVLNATALYSGKQLLALFVAVDCRNVVMLRKLIAAGADVNATIVGKEDKNLLSMVWAAMFATLAEPANLKDRNCQELAAFSDHVSIAQILIAAGADVRTKRSVPDFLMQQVAHPLAIPWLFAVTVHQQVEADVAPGLAADLYSSVLQLSRAMIEAGAHANGLCVRFGKDGKDALPLLAIALEVNFAIDAARMLLAAGADVNEKVFQAGSRIPLLGITILGGMKEWTSLLLEARADVNATFQVKEGEFPLLSQAFAKGNFEAARILLSAGADVNQKVLRLENHGYWLEMPLWFFLTKKQSLRSDDCYRAIQMAMTVGADANLICKTSTGDCFPPLKFAVDEGDPLLISLLIDSHADMNATINRVGGFERVCHYATDCEKLECVAVLVRAGANLNTFSRFPGFQQTPLGAAIKKCNYEIVRLLLDAKADITHVLTVQLDGDIDFDALMCTEKVIEEKQHDLVKYRCLVRIHALLSSYQPPPAAAAAPSRLYDIVIQSAFGCGNSCFRFYMDNEEQCTTSDLKKRIRREALFKCYIDFLVAPHLLVLVHKACIIHDSLPMSHVFSTDVTSKITCVVLASGSPHEVLHEDLQLELEESRRYVTVQTQVQRLREEMSQADKRGDYQAFDRYNIQVRQLLLDNQTPEWILQERLLRTAENNSLAHGHRHIGEKSVKVKMELERGNLEDARQLQMEIVQFHKMVENKADLSRSLVDLSEILRSLAQLDGAEAACDEAVDLLKQLHGETHPETLRVTGLYVGILIEMRRLKDADALLTSWFKASQRLLGSNHPQTRSCNYALKFFRRAHQIIWSDQLSASPMSLVPTPARSGLSDIVTHDDMHHSALQHASIPDVFNDGLRVRIEGLLDKPELNGRSGTILGVYNETRGRWTVELDATGTNCPSRVSLRPLNLKATSENDAITEQIKLFCDAGFERLHVLQCLAASKCHPDIAQEYLVNGLPENLQKQYVYGHLISKMWTQWFITHRASVEAHRAFPTPSTTAPSTPSSHTPPPICFDRAVHWIDDLGVLRPKTVDYSVQCPKGTDIKACPSLKEGCFVCSDRKSVGGLKCDSCCSYGVCKNCISILQDNQASESRSTEFPIFGVSLSFLKAFRSRWAAVYERWSTSQVVKMLIKPLTCVSRRSVCDDLMDKQSSDVGQATVFLSHVWNQPFCDTLDAFIEVADSWPPNSRVFAWIDIFSASQHASAEDLTSAWWMVAFKQAISKMGRVVMVMQPWDRPVALSRGWCMFELFSCVSTGGRLEVALPPSERLRFFQRDVSSRALFFQSLPELMNSKQAQFSREEDKVSILSSIESTVGFAAMDATLLRSVEAWYIPQFQLMAASASAFVDGFQKQAETFFQLAYLQYIRGDFSAAESTGQHCLDLLENAKSHISQNSISSERPGIIQAQILMMNSLHMQGKFQEARVHHFMLLNYLQVDRMAEPVPPRYDEETGIMLSDEVYQSTKKIRLRRKYFDAGSFSFVQCWRTLDLHKKLPYCALGIPAELAKTEDLSRAWAAKQSLGQEQALLAAASAASLLRDETFLKNYALDRHVSKFQGKCSKSVRALSQLIDLMRNHEEVSYQDIAGPIVTVMHAFFHAVKTTRRSKYCPRSHSSVEHLNQFVTKIVGTSTPNDGGVKSFAEDREERGGNDSDSLPSTEGEMGSEMCEKENDLEGYFDENDQFNAEDSLFRAAESGFAHVVQDLLQRKANVNSNNGTLHMTPLHAAAACGHDEVVRLLVKWNANVNSVITESQVGRAHCAPLHLACFNGQASIVRILVDAKADVNLMGTSHCSRLTVSPIYCAIMSSKASCDLIIRLLIEAKADVAARVAPFEAKAASTLAVDASDNDAGTGIIRVKEFNDDAGQPVRYQGTHYLYVDDEVHHPASSTIEFLGDSRSTKTLTVSHGRGPMKHEQDESVEGTHILEATALHVAVLKRRFDVCSLLIDNKADPNALASFKLSGASYSQCSALASALIIEAVDLIRPLLDAKADPNCSFTMSSDTEEMQKGTALFYSILKQQTGMCSLLIDGKADPNAFSSMRNPSDASFFQSSALGLAVILQSEDVIRPLLDAKADPNCAVSVQNADGANGANERIHQKSLKAADADVLAIPTIMYAVLRGNLPIVRCLVEAKADLNTANSSDIKTALQVAVDENMDEIAAYLRSTGAFSEPKASPVSLELPASDEILKSILHSAGATSALSQFEAAGIYDHCLESLSGFTSTHLHEAFGLSLQQAEQFSALLQQHLTVQFLDKEADHKRRVVESAGYDYFVFESLDRHSQEEVLSSIERQLASRPPPPSSS